MRTSEQINDLAAALAKAQGAFVNPERNREVEVKTKDGRKYKFRYATLDNIMDMVRKPLADCGLSFIQTLTRRESGSLDLATRLMHISGQWIETAHPVPVDGVKAQDVGSALTYARRYALTALLGVAADEDDDGNRADGNEAHDTGRQAAPPQRTVQQPPAQKPPKPDQIKVQVPDKPGPVEAPGLTLAHAEAWVATVEMLCLRGSADTSELRLWWDANLPIARDLAERHQRPQWVTKLTRAKDEVKNEFERQEAAA